MEKIESLSLVVPVYRQARTIQKNIAQVDTVLSNLGIPYELIIVIDGADGATEKNAKKYKSKRVKVLSYENNQGKGNAVRFGMMRATGKVIGFIDGGMDIDPTGIDMLINHFLWYNADIIVGSKLHPVSQVDYPFWRKVMSWGYRTLTKALFGFKIRDTQVGFKLFRSDVVSTVFPRLVVKSFAFDIETLAASYALGFKRIYEAPIRLDFNQNTSSITKMNFWKTILQMLGDTFLVFYRVRVTGYYKKNNGNSHS